MYGSAYDSPEGEGVLSFGDELGWMKKKKRRMELMMCVAMS